MRRSSRRSKVFLSLPFPRTIPNSIQFINLLVALTEQQVYYSPPSPVLGSVSIMGRLSGVSCHPHACVLVSQSIPFSLPLNLLIGVWPSSCPVVFRTPTPSLRAPIPKCLGSPLTPGIVITFPLALRHRAIDEARALG